MSEAHAPYPTQRKGEIEVARGVERTPMTIFGRRLRSSPLGSSSKTRSRDASVRIWAVLNSGFVIWLLSSVLVGAGSHWWATQQRRLDKQASEEIRVQRLRIELADRVLAAVGELGGALHYPTSYTRDDIRLALVRAGVFEGGTGIGGFAEFHGRSLPSLLWELAELRPNLEPKIRKTQVLLTACRAFLAFDASHKPTGWASGMAVGFFKQALDEMQTIVDTERITSYAEMPDKEFLSVEKEVHEELAKEADD